MTEVYLGQIMMTGFGFAPKTMTLCNGQIMPIAQNQALFSLLGTNYGGNGIQTFQLPNLQGITPVGAGASVDPSWQPTAMALGQFAGTENVTLTPSELPQHTHAIQATTTVGNSKAATNGVPATCNISTTLAYVAAGGPQATLYPATVGLSGLGQFHNNMQPYRTISFSIALQGIYPARN